jgi:hydrogenase maturation protein HypF
MFAVVAPGEVELALRMLRRGVNTPITTSVGRLFDGVSALLGLSYENTHQAQSPQLLEYAAWRHGPAAPALPLPVAAGDPARLDWRRLVIALVDGLETGASPDALAAGFHQALVEAATLVVRSVAPRQVALAGGVFCNRYLAEALLARLAQEGVPTCTHSLLPPTDGSLAAGQLWVAAHSRQSQRR